ncbi:MAG: beta-ketoacyl-ACP synthase II, partial [Candidatus Riflebacteria bacterium]|nr:beta-ketoacyl-ACP synthase II [Candidatus Riflebacteria bacterium]
MKRVFITGMGAITPNAVGIEDFTAALKEGKNGIGLTTLFDTTDFTVKISGEVKNFNPELYVNKKDAKRHDRYAVFALAAARMAAEQAKLTEKNFDPERAGVIVSTGIGGITFFENEHKTYLSSGPSRVSPFLVPMMICNIASGCIAMEYGLNGPNFSIVSACASSLHAIGESYLKIAHGESDIMVCGGSEAALTPLTTSGFAKMKALSTRNDEPEKASRAFDKDRDGFVMGEGAGVIVLESEESVLKRGSKILAEINGYGASADAHDIVAPDPDGKGALKSMEFALADAGLKPEDIDYINPHGTSTGLG